MTEPHGCQHFTIRALNFLEHCVETVRGLPPTSALKSLPPQLSSQASAEQEHPAKRSQQITDETTSDQHPSTAEGTAYMAVSVQQSRLYVPSAMPASPACLWLQPLQPRDKSKTISKEIANKMNKVKALTYTQ